jgi:flagellar hook-associated protein 3 FlgL
MRVSDTLQYRTVLSQLSAVQNRLLQATKQASSGLRLDRPSVDPTGAAQLARIQASLDATCNYRGVISTVQGDLEMAESTLATATQLTERATELALQGANGAQTAESRNHIAQEVRRLREQLLALANQKGTQGYLFSGTATDTAPFTAAGVFAGDDNDRVAEIGKNDSAVVSVSGARAFTIAGGRDVFADLADLETALLTNDQAAITTSVSIADTCRRQILAARVDAGLKLDRLQTASSVHEQVQLALAKHRGDVADADPVEAYSRFVALQQGLDQAIAVSRSILGSIGKARFG